MRLFAALSVALLAFNATAADRIVIDAYTKHSSDCQNAYSRVCEPWQQPKRMSWQHDITSDLSTDIGIGTNSYGKSSVSAGAMYLPLSIGSVQVGAFAALVSGYTCDQLKTCVFVAGGALSAQMGNAVMQVLYVPSVGGGTVSVVQMRVGMEF